MNNAQTNALRLAAVLWMIWGLTHAFFGIGIMAAVPSQGFAYIAGNVPPEALQADYHSAIGGILKQHGWNLLWFGIVTSIGAVMIWRGSKTAIWVSAMVGGLADLGYLLFVDIPGYAPFFPGTVMTIIAGSAIVLSLWAYRQTGKR